jgi:hypothetical protein
VVGGHAVESEAVLELGECLFLCSAPGHEVPEGDGRTDLLVAGDPEYS